MSYIDKVQIGSTEYDVQDTKTQQMIAGVYSTSGTYAVGDYVTYDGKLYRCVTAIDTAEAWTVAHWTEVTVGGDVADLKSAIASEQDIMLEILLDGTNTSRVFEYWFPEARKTDEAAGRNRYNTLERWFTVLRKAWAGKYYTLRYADYRAGSDHTITPMGDLNGKSAAVCATEATPNAFDWADEDPMTWYVRANALSLADGTMDVVAIEGIDSTFDITGNLAPVYTFRLGLFKRTYNDGTYEYKTFVTMPEDGFAPWAADVDPADNSHRIVNWQSTFDGSLTADGALTSGSGYGDGYARNTNTTAFRRSAYTGLSDARKWDAYEGTYSDTDLEPILDLFQLRHHDLENSGIIEGCLSYNYQYTVAMAENDATSVLLTTAQAANLLVGSAVCVGSHPEGTNTDRNTAKNYDIIPYANIVSIESETIEGTTYARINLDIEDGVDIPATGYVSTMPWVPGSTEWLPGHKDGCIGSCTNGKAPARIAGVEIICGAYAIGLDPLWNSDYDASRSPKCIYTVYQCRDSEKQSNTITANYTESGTFTSENSGWQYVKHFEIRTDGMIVPDALGGSSTTYLKSAFYFRDSSGVRAPWRFCDLTDGGLGGLAGASGYLTPGYASWPGRPRLSGSGKKRGEWAA